MNTQGRIEDFYVRGNILGRGEFAVVYAGMHKETHEQYAIKIIDKKKIDVKRLHTEVSILSTVKHPNIISLKETFDTETELYLVMELVTGGELFDKIIEEGAYSETKACLCVQKILSAVEYLHELNIVHRDLKPTNLLLKDPNDLTDVKLADFGLSKLLSDDILMHTACGTPIYVAPEVLNGEGYDKEVDLWSVGVIMYILLCGFPPFFDDTNDITNLFEQILSGVYDFPEPYWDDVSASAKDLIGRLLVVEPKNRLSATQALQHPWFQNFARPEQESPVLQQTKSNLNHFKKTGKSAVNLRRDTAGSRSVC